MTRRWITLAATAAALLAPVPAYAWNDIGHRVVARIAWWHMKPETRRRAIELLRAAPAGAGLRDLFPTDGRPLDARERILFESASVWADMIRGREHPGNAYDRGTWHYVNLFWRQPAPGAPGVDLPERGTNGDLVEQLRRIDGALAGAGADPAARAIDLAWALHLVGDSHQPLHCSARVTPAEPDGDRGGNLFRLGDDRNLHSYWDGILTRTHRRRDREGRDAYVERVARAIVAEHPRAAFEDRLRPGDYDAWAREGVDIAKTHVYTAHLERGQEPPPDYRRHAYRVAAGQAALAGYRIAELLDRTLAP